MMFLLLAGMITGSPGNNSSMEWFGAKQRATYAYERQYGVRPTECIPRSASVDCDGPKGKQTYNWYGSPQP
jgi:hypothetical protein